jgi:hypothetical protein
MFEIDNWREVIMKNLMNKSTILFVCVLLVCSMFVLGGCGQEEAQYSVFWSMDQSESPESAYMLHQLKDAFVGTEDTDQTDEEETIENKETIFNTLTLEMFPDSQKTATFKIWNRQEAPDTKTTFKISADAGWITFPEKRIEVLTPKQSEETNQNKNSENEKQQTLAHVGSEVNIRSGATTKSDILLQTETYSTYLFLSKVIGEDDDMVWYEIELDDETIGWVRSDMATIKSTDETKQTSQIISELADFTTITCEIVLPEDIKLPLESTITIIPSNGGETTLKIKIVEPDWWSVKWVSSGTENHSVNLFAENYKKLEVEVKNNSTNKAQFEILSENKYVNIKIPKSIILKPGESKVTQIEISYYEKVEENIKVEELITITAIKLLPSENMEDTKKIYKPKQLKLEITIIKSNLDVVWEETGTDTIIVEHYPYMPVLTNVIYANNTEYGIAIDIDNCHYETEVVKGETISRPKIIFSSNEYGFNYPFSSFLKKYNLTINEVIKPPPCDIKPTIDWKESQECVYTLFSDDKIFAITKDKNEYRKLKCYDLNTAEFLWEYPNGDNPDYELISKTLILEDFSKKFDKVIIQYVKDRKDLDNQGYITINSCLEAKNGDTNWELESREFLGIYGDTDKFLVKGNKEKDSNGRHIKYNFECRKLTTNEILWSDFFQLVGFAYANDNVAYFYGSEQEYTGGTISGNPPKETYSYDISLYDIIFPHESPDTEKIKNWSEEKRNRIEIIKNYENYFFINEYYETKNDIIILKGYNCGNESCVVSRFYVFNATTGDIITATDNYSIYKPGKKILTHFQDNPIPTNIYNFEGEIIELHGYFFKIPSGEHIDLPTSYRLQHYSETTGNYYFLDTEKGEIVCVTLPESPTKTKCDQVPLYEEGDLSTELF